MQDSLAISVFIILVGPFVGSFIGVLVDRMKRGADVVVAPSTCQTCGLRLRIFDLVPILSFLGAQGRCRHCGVTLPRWLLGLELLAGALGIAAVVAGDGLVGALVLWLLLALGAVDAAVFRLPNLLVAALLLAVLLRAPDLSQALIGAALGSGIFALIRWGYGSVRGREGMGLGDVKLMAPLGAFVGPLLLPQLVLVAAALAFAGALVLRRSGEALSAATPLPFGTALCASAFLLWVVLGL